MESNSRSSTDLSRVSSTGRQASSRGSRRHSVSTVCKRTEEGQLDDEERRKESEDEQHWAPSVSQENEKRVSSVRTRLDAVEQLTLSSGVGESSVEAGSRAQLGR